MDDRENHARRILQSRQFSVANDTYHGGPGKAAEVGGWYPNKSWAGTSIHEPNKEEMVKRLKNSVPMLEEGYEDSDAQDYADSLKPKDLN